MGCLKNVSIDHVVFNTLFSKKRFTAVMMRGTRSESSVTSFLREVYLIGRLYELGILSMAEYGSLVCSADKVAAVDIIGHVVA